MMETKQQRTAQPTFLGFASQKGGVGKSSLAEVLASVLYYEKGVNLLVVDCDSTQASFYKLRQRERIYIEDHPDIAKQMAQFFTEFGKPAYPIVRSTPKEAIEEAKRYMASSPQAVDLVIFDFPGHAGTEDLLQLSIEMDYIISPIEADTQSLVSAFAYAQTIRDLGIGFEEARIKDLFLLWNKINRSAGTAIIDLYTRYAQEELINLFEARIYHSVKLYRELGQGGVKSVFRSSYLPPASAYRPAIGIDVWVEEVIEKLHLKVRPL